MPDQSGARSANSSRRPRAFRRPASRRPGPLPCRRRCGSPHAFPGRRTAWDAVHPALGVRERAVLLGEARGGEDDVRRTCGSATTARRAYGAVRTRPWTHARRGGTVSAAVADDVPQESATSATTTPSPPAATSLTLTIRRRVPVRHMGVSTFRGSLDDVAASLRTEDGALVLDGAARAESISSAVPQPPRPCPRPGFLDAARHPEVASAPATWSSTLTAAPASAASRRSATRPAPLEAKIGTWRPEGGGTCSGGTLLVGRSSPWGSSRR